MGRRVWISRPAARAGELADALRKLGLTPHVCPAMHIADLPETPALEIYYRDIARFEASIFVTAEAARRVGANMPPLPAASLPALAVGEATASALPAAYRLLTPPSAVVADGRALLRLPSLRAPGALALLGGADEAGNPPSPPLCRALSRRGAEVLSVPCYVRRAAAADAELSALGRDGAVFAAVAHSADSVRFMLGMTAPENDWLLRCPLFVIHPNIARAAEQFGFRRVVVAAPAQMARRIADYWRQDARPPADVG